MKDYSALAADLLANKDKYIVDRNEKMDRTIDKMVDNHNKRLAATRNRDFDIGAAVRGRSGKLD